MKSRNAPAAKANSRGFTLIELMIVMVIMGVLTAIAMPAYQSYAVKVRMADMQRYALLLTGDQDTYYEENGRFYGMNSTERQKVDVGGDDDRGFDTYHHWTATTGTGTVVLIIIVTNENLHPDALSNKRFIYEGHADSFGRVTWECVQHKSVSLRMDAEYVPEECEELYSFPN